MRPQIANLLGVAADTIAGLAIAAYAYSQTLPYRLSAQQEAAYGVALSVGIYGPMISIALGVCALFGGSRARRLGYCAIALMVPTLVWAFLTVVEPHSISFR